MTIVFFCWTTTRNALTCSLVNFCEFARMTRVVVYVADIMWICQPHIETN